MIGYFNQFPLKTQVVMEATCGWGWLSEVLQDLGLEVKLANPSKVEIIAESQIKTDKVDALALAQLLRTNFLPGFYLAPKEQREARDLLRYRISLVHLRSGVKNRVHALPRRASVCLLTRLGIYHNYSDLFGKRGRSFLSSLELSPVHPACGGTTAAVAHHLLVIVYHTCAHVSSKRKESIVLINSEGTCRAGPC